MGYDSDHRMAEGEVGRAGVAIDSVDDLERLFHGIPLDKVSTSMTINATAAILLAMYVAVGEEQGVPLTKLQGTLQNDILKEYIARGTYIYPPEPSLRLVADIFRFTSRAKMSFKPDFDLGLPHARGGRDGGARIGVHLCQRFGIRAPCAVRRTGGERSRSATLLLFFSAAYTDLFEEIAKFRAARRLWYRLMKEKFNASDAAARLRFHTQTGGATLTAQTAAQQRGAGRDSGDGRRAGRHAVAPYQLVRRSAGAAHRAQRDNWRSEPSSCSPTKRACRTWSIRLAAAGTWRA